MSLPFFRNQCPNWNVLFQINFRDELRCGQEDFSSQKACVKGLCVTSLQPWKPRGFAKLHLSTGSVPELECFVLLHCSLGFNFLILKFAMFSSHRQAGEEYCEWAVTISTGRGKVTALGDLLAANLKIHVRRKPGHNAEFHRSYDLGKCEREGVVFCLDAESRAELEFLSLMFDASWLLLFIRMWFPILCQQSAVAPLESFMDKALSMHLLRKSFAIMVHRNALIRTFKIMSFCLSVVTLYMEVKIKNCWVQSGNLW